MAASLKSPGFFRHEACECDCLDRSGTSRRYEEFVELEGRGDFLERGELGAAPLTSGCGLDREGSWISQAPPLGDVGEERLDSLLAFEGWEKESSLPPSAGLKKRESLWGDFSLYWPR
ncbi:unnamed protein product [Pleuronectes platessa]|uniref:Uncharacterized protein n=1 Tax=Pleuronectes platessa TaxID=8262 RepID=A0A9N7TV26_PLEPL|nr:unnamed protein product [Pleuronectes platessa]